MPTVVIASQKKERDCYGLPYLSEVKNQETVAHVNRQDVEPVYGKPMGEAVHRIGAKQGRQEKNHGAGAAKIFDGVVEQVIPDLVRRLDESLIEIKVDGVLRQIEVLEESLVSWPVLSRLPSQAAEEANGKKS